MASMLYDIFSKSGFFGCSQFIIGSYNTLVIHLNFMEDV